MGFSMWSIATQPANLPTSPSCPSSGDPAEGSKHAPGAVASPGRGWWDDYLDLTAGGMSVTKTCYKNLLNIRYQYNRMFGTPETCLQKDLLQETSSIELQDDFVEYNDWTYLFPRICHILHHLRPNWSVEWIRWCSACQSPPKKHTTSIPCVDTSFLALSGNIPPIH